MRETAGPKINSVGSENFDPNTFLFRTKEELCLHFDGIHIQSLMLLTDPNKLMLEYTQAMMGFKLFRQDLSNILIFGLGGGSLSKYCYDRFEDTRVTTVEISQAVIDLRAAFKIPDDNERFRVVHSDAADFARKAAKDSVDVILLDAYNKDGLPASLSSNEFIQRCFDLLRDDGMMVANFLDDDSGLIGHIKNFSQIFSQNCLIGYAKSCGNYVVIGRKGINDLREDISTDLRRLTIKHRRGLKIPYFATLSEFFQAPRY